MRKFLLFASIAKYPFQISIPYLGARMGRVSIPEIPFAFSSGDCANISLASDQIALLFPLWASDRARAIASRSTVRSCSRRANVRNVSINAHDASLRVSFIRRFMLCRDRAFVSRFRAPLMPQWGAKGRGPACSPLCHSGLCRQTRQEGAQSAWD